MTPGSLRLRSFNETDTDAVVDLWQTAFPDDPPRNEPIAVIRRKRAVQQELFLVAEVDGQLVGALLAGYDGFRGWMSHLAVGPEWRRRGIGTALLKEAESRLSLVGCPKANLQVRGHNRAVVRFFESAGYEVEDRVSMGKLLGRRR